VTATPTRDCLNYYYLKCTTASPLLLCALAPSCMSPRCDFLPRRHLCIVVFRGGERANHTYKCRAENNIKKSGQQYVIPRLGCEVKAMAYGDSGISSMVTLASTKSLTSMNVNVSHLHECVISRLINNVSYLDSGMKSGAPSPTDCHLPPAREIRRGYLYI